MINKASKESPKYQWYLLSFVERVKICFSLKNMYVRSNHKERLLSTTETSSNLSELFIWSDCEIEFVSISFLFFPKKPITFYVNLPLCNPPYSGLWAPKFWTCWVFAYSFIQKYPNVIIQTCVPRAATLFKIFQNFTRHHGRSFFWQIKGGGCQE